MGVESTRLLLELVQFHDLRLHFRFLLADLDDASRVTPFAFGYRGNERPPSA